MNLKLIGSDSSNGLKILKNIKKVERELKCSLNINTVSKNKNKDKSIILPTLVIDGKIVSQGKVIDTKELKSIIKPLLPEYNC